MDKKKEQKESVLIDDVAQTPDFDEQMLETNLKTMKESNPALHSVMMKYKNFHADESSTKED